MIRTKKNTKTKP